MKVYREEHPNPQWERENWRNLNGEWEFDFDFGKSARDRKLWESDSLPKRINVPFCPESVLSGIGYTDFMAAVCYRRTFALSAEECKNNVILHFGAVDYKSFIYINGKEVFSHIGGYSSFAVDITSYIKEGENVVFVIAEDDSKGGKQARGKQAALYYSSGCDYTRTTGIWQTVWLEFVPKSYIKDAKYYTDIDNSNVMINGNVFGKGTLTATAYFDGVKQGETSIVVNGGFFNLSLNLSELHLWEPGKGGLYNLELTFNEDKVKSYFGMRKVALEGKKFFLNNKCVFQRTVLDQGFYKEGIYTAKSDEELKNDIILSMNAGFNGARLHQKIFEARYLYHCDKLGYMVWGEHANWGMDYRDAVSTENFINEWVEAVNRDFNHPSIIGWCPMNETWGYTEIYLPNRILETVYNITKAMDPTRLCIETSGNYHIDGTEIFDLHNYEQDVEKFKAEYANIKDGKLRDVSSEGHQEYGQNGRKYKGEAVFVSEYGGIGWKPDNSLEGWGYGVGPKTEEEFIARYKGLTEALLDNPDIMGFCYTQLYDVEQEINGLYTYERKPKFDINIFKEINSKKAAIED